MNREKLNECLSSRKTYIVEIRKVAKKIDKERKGMRVVEVYDSEKGYFVEKSVGQVLLDIGILPLSEEICSRLNRSGYWVIGQLFKLSELDLYKMNKLSRDDAADVWNVLKDLRKFVKTEDFIIAEGRMVLIEGSEW